MSLSSQVLKKCQLRNFHTLYKNMIKIDVGTLKESYEGKTPYNYITVDNFLDLEDAVNLQDEIMNLDTSAFDRYDNPFEQKWTLRDKWAYPPILNRLANEFVSEKQISQLSMMTGHDLINDPTRNFWGVHLYGCGDYLDIHVDANYHPTTRQRKQITVGLYLSYEWDSEYGCELELWEGDEHSAITRCVEKVAPLFNRLVVFDSSPLDGTMSWHGNPNPSSAPDGKRIFVTFSYLTKEIGEPRKALFVARPTDPPDGEKDRLRALRADPKKAHDVYRML